MNQYGGAALPFFDDVETTKWRWPNGSYLEIEKTSDGWHVHGRFVVVSDGRSRQHIQFCDSDGEDFYCATSDELLDLLTKYNLHRMLQG